MPRAVASKKRVKASRFAGQAARLACRAQLSAGHLVIFCLSRCYITPLLTARLRLFVPARGIRHIAAVDGLAWDAAGVARAHFEEAEGARCCGDALVGCVGEQAVADRSEGCDVGCEPGCGALGTVRTELGVAAGCDEMAGHALAEAQDALEPAHAAWVFVDAPGHDGAYKL